MSGAVTHRPRVCGWPLFVMDHTGSPGGEADIWLYLNEAPGSTAWDIAQATGRAPDSIRRVLQRWLREGSVRRVPSRQRAEFFPIETETTNA